jgi:hypothetical protein
VSVAFNISKEMTTEDLMRELDKLYEKSSASNKVLSEQHMRNSSPQKLENNKVFLMKQFFNMKMLEVGYGFDHLNEFNTVTNQLSYVKVEFDDEVRSLLILCSFLESWIGLVMDVSNSVSGSNTLEFDGVVGVILSEEII